MKILFDDANLHAAAVGSANGIRSGEFDRARAKALRALSGFRKQSEAGLYGFPHQPFQKRVINGVLEYAASVRGSYDTVLLIGIGGSALGAYALDCGIRGPHPVQGPITPERPRLVILDNVDPSFTASALASMEPAKTLVVAIAKSGGTAETVASFLIVRDWMERARAGSANRIAAVTTEGKGDLSALAGREGYKTFGIPANVGGRFSVLTPLGLLPAALIGIDIAKLTRGAARMTAECWKPDLDRNLALRAAVCHWLIWTRRNKSIQVAFPYSNQLWGTAFWFRQLWAESLGKAHLRSGDNRREVNIGQTPVAALGTTDQHSQVQLYVEGPNDKVFTFWAVEKHAWRGEIPAQRLGFEAFDALAGKSLAELIDAERRATAAALTEHKRPNCTVTLGRVDEEHIGAFLQMMEFQTAFMGELLGINAFDQPGVQLAKIYTGKLMRGEPLGK